MNCDELVEVVTDFLDDALDAATRRRFTEHLAECDGCDAYVGQLRTTIGLTGTLRADDLQPDLRDRLLTAFRDWKAHPSPR
ncbi:anti-sigma factor family protein [Frankia sp. AgKG'84/4]|uniref:anti-sigma factor family protein n=1 Tax=Frankia sp. AgKG'84/4 TaxID=573490 RepID=UPI00200ED486|nr:anti-sigma factor [Frankia sp. AgKG'84/4]MCL9796112.1 anti-sigma factor [Frankia sp. AgKG'84/4]